MKPLPVPRLPGRERGAFAILYAMMFPVMLGMAGLALDLSMMYARRHEMQSVADGAALAAARALDGTTGGIAAALLAAQNIAIQGQYRFLSPAAVGWSNNALRFGQNATGPWLTSAEIGAAQAAKMYFTRVDSDRLDAALGKVTISFTRVLGVTPEQNAHAFAVAGRRDSVIAPLAICALEPEAVGHRSNGAAAFEEVIEFGFRRGVSYNLLNLNPHSSSPINYVFNPLGYHGSVANDLTEAVRPFACTGAAPAAPIDATTTLAVRSPFPTSLIAELNARFSPYPTGTACTEYSAPPDANVYDFRGWYTSPPAAQPPTALAGSAREYIVAATPGNPLQPGKVISVADVVGPPAAPNAGSYGPLWAFARPLKYDLVAGAATTTPFVKGDWSTLYPVTTAPAPSTTYSGTLPPYLGAMPPVETAATGFKTVPKNSSNQTIVGLPFRRVLNVPLLACPVTDPANAIVLGIGRFMMPTKAVVGPPAALHAEFGGVTTYGAMAASAVLYQ
jgi:hypothetical protein